MDAQDGTFYECAVCLEHFFAGSNPRFAVADDPTSFICRDCADKEIVPKFWAALKHEHNYPVRWGNESVQITAFADILGQAVVNDFHVREIEYTTPANRRIYCPSHLIPGEDRCNQFIGVRGSGEKYCPRCTVPVCTTCEAVVNFGSGHHCPGQPPKEYAEASDAFGFEGIERGIEWQQCPHCGRKAERMEGCNDIGCQCGNHFCFLCGNLVPVHEFHTHWTRAAGGCQRYGDRLHHPPPGVQEFDDDNEFEDFTDEELQDFIQNEVFPPQHHQVEDALVEDLSGLAGGPQPGSTPSSDSDFLGAARSHQNLDDLAANGPRIAAMFRAFDAVHNPTNPGLRMTPLNSPDNLQVVTYLRNDRNTMYGFVANDLQAQEYAALHPPPASQPNFQEEAGNLINIGHLSHALIHLLSTILIAYTDSTADLNDLAASLRLAQQQVRNHTRHVWADSLPPNIDNIQYVRTGEVDIIQDFIARKLRANAEGMVHSEGGRTPRAAVSTAASSAAHTPAAVPDAAEDTWEGWWLTPPRAPIHSPSLDSRAPLTSTPVPSTTHGPASIPGPSEGETPDVEMTAAPLLDEEEAGGPSYHPPCLGPSEDYDHPDTWRNRTP